MHSPCCKHFCDSAGAGDWIGRWHLPTTMRTHLRSNHHRSDNLTERHPCRTQASKLRCCIHPPIPAVLPRTSSYDWPQAPTGTPPWPRASGRATPPRRPPPPGSSRWSWRSTAGSQAAHPRAGRRGVCHVLIGLFYDRAGRRGVCHVLMGLVYEERGTSSQISLRLLSFLFRLFCGKGRGNIGLYVLTFSSCKKKLSSLPADAASNATMLCASPCARLLVSQTPFAARFVTSKEIFFRVSGLGFGCRAQGLGFSSHPPAEHPTAAAALPARIWCVRAA